MMLHNLFCRRARSPRPGSQSSGHRLLSFEPLEPRLLLSHRPGHGGAPPPADPAIAFEAWDFKGEDLMVMNADGSNQTTILSRDGWFFVRPSWSPVVQLDGTRSVAVTAFEGGTHAGTERGFRVVDVKVIAGTPQLTDERVLVPAARVIGLAWSPDGQWIAYAEALASGSGPERMNLIAAAGGVPITVIDTGLLPRHPTWSPDGTRLAYTRLDFSNIMPNGTPEDSIWVKNLDVNSDGAVSSADLAALDPLDPGTGILFERDTSINFMSGLDWSRTGTTLAFSGHLPDGVFHIFTVDAVVGLSSLQTVPSTEGAGSPSWSSDDPLTVTNETDRFLVYSEPAANGRPRIVRQDLATGTEVVLAASPKFRFDRPDWARFPTSGWAASGSSTASSSTSSTASSSLAAASSSTVLVLPETDAEGSLSRAPLVSNRAWSRFDVGRAPHNQPIAPAGDGSDSAAVPTQSAFALSDGPSAELIDQALADWVESPLDEALLSQLALALSLAR